MATKKEEPKAEPKSATEANLEIYNKVRSVPAEALKSIGAGRLKGMSDINPMWRIFIMTQTFGPCGIGWKYEITKQWSEPFGDEVKAYCNINLYIKVDGVWSDPIPGTGGSSESTMERNGVYVSDECYKMALTDAFSVAMKAIGVGADIYFAKGKSITDPSTKYNFDEQKARNELPATASGSSSDIFAAEEALKQAKTKHDLAEIAKRFKPLLADQTFLKMCSNKKKELGIA